MKKVHHLFYAFIAVVGCELVGILSAFSMTDSISTWYVFLNKPAFTPPNWLFGPVWTTLYALMGIAIFIVWNTKEPMMTRVRKVVGAKVNTHKQDAFILFGVQLVLNALWTPIFFGLKQPDLALIIIGFMWFAILWTIVLFYRVSKFAAYLLVPYLVWVSVAVYLNASIWLLN